MPRKLADILRSARQQYFTGRDKEIQLFKSMVQAPQLPAFLLYLHGPGGQGKTTLAKAYMDICLQEGIPYIHADGRDINASPTHFISALQNLLQTEGDVFEALQQTDGKRVLFIDTYEKLNPIDDWMRQTFLPQMPENVLTVISGRKAPAKNWLLDNGWQQLMRTLHIRNLTPTESRELLLKRFVPEAEIDRILDFTHGHPLALSVVADTYAQQSDRQFNPDESPDMVRTLLESFVQKAPSPAHRIALEICAIVYITTESLLQQVMGVEDASELFTWLQELSFVESNKRGLYPHDLARDAICADLRWRNPDWNRELYNRIRLYYTGKFDQVSGDEMRLLLFKLNFLHRQHPMVRPYFDWQESGSYWMEMMQPDDIPYLQAMVQQHEGNEGLEQFNYCCALPASETWVFRNFDRKPCGFVLRLNLNEIETGEAIADPVTAAAKQYANQQLNLRKGDICTLFRFWMATDTYQAVSNLQSSMFLAIVQYYLATPALAVTFLNCARPLFWKMVLTYADLEHIAPLDFTVNEVPHGWYMHDWRKTPPGAWLNTLGQRELGFEVAQDNRKVQMLVLSEEEFASSVYEALKDYQNDKKLLANPLLRSRFVMSFADNDSDTAILLASLKDCLGDATDKIKESVKDEKLHRVLFRTFFNPVGSQEQAADFLNLPFSTYRRYLRKAVNIVTENLWKWEIEGR
jgi:ATPase family associated with various cellular activities (AAA)